MTDYIGVLAELRTRREALQHEQAELDTAITAIERLARMAGVAGTTKTDAASTTVYRGMTMPRALESYFKATALPLLTTRQVIDGLTAGGVKATKGIRGHVYSTLHRLSQNNGLFRHHDDGRWSLRERNVNDS